LRLRAESLFSVVTATVAATLVMTAPAQAADGTWERAWGKDVDTGLGAGFEICVTAASCKGGVSGGLGGEFNTPTAVAADPSGNVYVADHLNNRIQKFDSAGNFLRAWGRDVDVGGGGGFEICTVAASCKAGTAGGLGGEMDRPIDVTTDAAGNVYVAENDGHRIQKFAPSGAFLQAWGKDVVDNGAGSTGAEVCLAAGSCKTAVAGGLGGEFNFPGGVVVASSGDVYVSDGSNNRVQRFDSNGIFELTWGKDVDTAGATGAEICVTATSCKAGVTGVLGGEFDNPNGSMGLDAAGNLYLTDLSNERVQVFGSSGTFLRAWGKDVVNNGPGSTGAEVCVAAGSCKRGQINGGLGGELTNPLGLAVDAAAGVVYVLDRSSRRIQKFDTSGAFLRTWGKDVAVSGGTGFEICTVASSCKQGVTGALGGEMDLGQSVAVDGAGSVYLAETNSDRIQKFADPVTPPPPGGGGGGGGGGETPPSADTSAPNTTITGGPKKKEKKGKASFSFTSTEPGSSFQCSLDDGPFQTCTSPEAVRVRKGKHSFEVRATDAAGNTDPTPATQSWTVKKKKKK
jgi:DNA-binding beta-propeller fold protein YncE